MFRLVTKR